MSLTTARLNLLNAEKNVTNTLNTYGEDSEEYKKALKNFAKSWIFLSSRQDVVENILED